MPKNPDRGGMREGAEPKDEKDNRMQREHESLEEMYKKMETADGMRKVVASTMYGHGEAKCRDCGEVVNYNVSDPSVSVKPVRTRTKSSHLVGPKEVKAFEFSMSCPKDKKKINLGKFRKGAGLDKVDPGDLLSEGSYLSEIAEVYRSEDVVRLFRKK